MIYNVVINSLNFVGGTDVYDLEYNFDWSNFQEGEYELTFNFTAPNTTAFEPIVISVNNLGVCMNTFTTTSATNQKFNNTLGCASAVRNTTADYTYSVSTVFNPPIHLLNRPMGNNFTVVLRELDGTLYDIVVDYILILSFRKL